MSQLDSPFQLQEHLKALYHNYTKPDSSRTVVPITREVAVYLAEPPEGVERSLWLYELCRFLTMKVNNLIIAFFAEDPPCSSQTCPEMRASEWQYLCAVHDPPKSCCAIDYCCHTLDWATNILTSPKYFPSRLTLGSEAGGGPQASMRHLTNIFRRLYRIFAHAWFQHRGVFWQVEGHDGLYVFFKTVCDVYNLIPEDNYTIPPEAEGPETQTQTQAPPDNRVEGRRLTILRKEPEGPGAAAAGRPASEETTTEHSPISTGATTRRHKHSPSTGSMVTTIAEGAEESEQEMLQNLEEDLTEDPQTAKPAEEIFEGPDSAQQSPVTDTTPIEQEQEQETKSEEPSAEEKASPSAEESDKSKPEEEPEKPTEEETKEEETKPETQAPAEPEPEPSAAAEEDKDKEEKDEEKEKKNEPELETPTAESDDQAQAPAASVESEPEPAKDAKES